MRRRDSKSLAKGRAGKIQNPKFKFDEFQSLWEKDTSATLLRRDKSVSPTSAAMNHYPCTSMQMKPLTGTGTGMADQSFLRAVRPEATATPSWVGRINVWMTDEFCARIPEGFEDADGFHYVPAGPRSRTWQTTVPAA